jgi:hypothetical protein
MRKWQTRLMCLPLCLFLFGCSRGHPTAPVSGTVTYKGQPVAFGQVTFIHTYGHTAFGPIKDGRYSMRAPVGDCRVAISSLESDPPQDPKQRKQIRPGMVVPKSFIPEKYQRPDKSGLTFKVENKENIADFTLQD